MENLKEKALKMKEQNHYKQVNFDLITLIKKGIIQKESTEDIAGYEQVDNKDLVYKMEYHLYENKTKSSYAYIKKENSVDDNGTNKDSYSVFEIDYSDVRLVRELVDTSRLVVSSNSDNLIKTLNIIGWIVVVIGVLLGLMGAEDGFQFLLLGVLGGITSGVIFFALAAIIKHLQSIDMKMNKYKETNE